MVSGLARGQESPPLRVRFQAAGGSCYVGEGTELVVAVTGRDQRPNLNLPRVARAEIWTAGTSFQPVDSTTIGKISSGTNVYITRLRLVPHHAGPLLIPPVAVHLADRSGRSNAITLQVQSVPLDGRPAEFLGGIGAFEVEAHVSPSTIRLGQELRYLVTIKGPAAWGSVSRPELGRLSRADQGARLEELPEEIGREPPKRTWVYRIRPGRAGDFVLPPVAIAAFDPSSARFFTKATQGLHVKVVAAPPVDLQSFRYAAPDLESERRRVMTRVFAAFVGILIVASGLAVIVQRGAFPDELTGPLPAQRFARRFARDLSYRSALLLRRNVAPGDARAVIDALITYARIGADRPPGAITPVEAGQLVLELTRSNQVAKQASDLVARCDRVLFSEPEAGGDDTHLLRHARELFNALGRAPGPRSDRLNGPPARANG
jgi:hypothetical protein